MILIVRRNYRRKENDDEMYSAWEIKPPHGVAVCYYCPRNGTQSGVLAECVYFADRCNCHLGTHKHHHTGSANLPVYMGPWPYMANCMACNICYAPMPYIVSNIMLNFPWRTFMNVFSYSKLLLWLNINNLYPNPSGLSHKSYLITVYDMQWTFQVFSTIFPNICSNHHVMTSMTSEEYLGEFLFSLYHCGAVCNIV